MLPLLFKCNDKGLAGVYYSKAPTKLELYTLMYFRGNFNAAHTRTDNLKLVLNEDNTFESSVKPCNAAIKIYRGTWSEKDGVVNLTYDKSSKAETYTIGKDKLYSISERVSLNGNKKFKCLTLLRKQ